MSADSKTEKLIRSSSAFRSRPNLVAPCLAILRTHPSPHKFVSSLLAIIEADLSEDYKNPEHELRTRAIKMALDWDDIRVASQVISLFWPKADLSILGPCDPNKSRELSHKLARDGYAIEENYLDDEQIAQLIELISSPKYEFVEKNKAVIHRGYNPATAESATANTVTLVNQNTLTQENSIQDLAFDPLIVSIVQNYLGSPPIHVQSHCWWSLDHATDAKSLAASAQKYHQDKGFVKFVKAFIYLTDVTTQNGPHQFIRCSNHDFKTAFPRRYKAGKRIDEKDIEKKFGADRVVTMTAPRGTLILEDTHGFHRGVPVQSGHRLLIQFEYANSLFCSAVSRFTHNRDLSDLSPSQTRLFANYDRSSE